MPHLFFNPLDRLLKLRRLSILDKKLQTLKLYREVKGTVEYMLYERMLASEKANMLYNKYSYQINCRREKVFLTLKAKSSLKCNENIIRVISETNISKKNFLLEKNNIVKTILRKIVGE
jgi:hypothetical protein